MQRLCKLLQMDRDEKCIDWMHSAVDHCSEVICEYKVPDSDLWTAMRSAFATENEYVKGLMSDIKLGPDSNPRELSFAECNTVLTSIARDYFTRWPYIHIMDKMSIGSWTVLLGVIVILSIFGLVYVVLFCMQRLDGSKFWNTWISSPEIDFQNQTVPLKRTDSSSSTDNAAKRIIIKVATSVGDGVNNSFKNVDPIEVFCVPADGVSDITKELPYKRATIEEVLNFLEHYPNKLRVILFFDDIKVYNDVCKRCFMRRLEEKSPKFCSRSSSHISVSSTTSGRSRIPVVFKENSHISKPNN